MANLLTVSQVRCVDTVGARSSILSGSRLAFAVPGARPQVQRKPRLGTVVPAAGVAPCNLLKISVGVTSARRKQTVVRSVSRERDAVQPAELLHALGWLNPMPPGAPTPHPTTTGALAADHTAEWQELVSNSETELFGPRSASDAATAEMPLSSILDRRKVVLEELKHLPLDRVRDYIASKLPAYPGEDVIKAANGAMKILIPFTTFVIPWLIYLLPFVTWEYWQVQSIFGFLLGVAVFHHRRCESMLWDEFDRLEAIRRKYNRSTRR